MNAFTPSDALVGEPEITVTWEGDRAPFAKAFVAAQMSMESVKKAATNPAFKTKYADLSQVVEGVIPALNGANIGVMQFPSYDGDLVGIATTFLHESGSSVTGVLHLRPSKTDPQGVGSAITYGRRYSLLAMTGAAPEDDDGNAASGPRNGPGAEQKAMDQLKTCAVDPGIFKECWEKNKAAWKNLLAPDAYARVVAEMKRLSERFKAEAAQPAPPPADDFGIGADEIPF